MHRQGDPRQDGEHLHEGAQKAPVEDLKKRIRKGIAEINAAPVVFRWNKFDLGVT